MTSTEYIRDRLDEQAAWHSKKSTRCKRFYQGLMLANVVAAAALPVLSAVGAHYQELGSTITLLIGAVGALIAVLSGVIVLFKFHENWIEYRLLEEGLKRERYLFLARAAPYDTPGGEASFSVLVERVEGMLAKSASAWAQTVRGTPASVGQSAEHAAVNGGGSTPVGGVASESSPAAV